MPQLPQSGRQRGTTLVEAWRALMQTLAYENPAKALQARQAVRVVRNMMAGRQVWR